MQARSTTWKAALRALAAVMGMLGATGAVAQAWVVAQLMEPDGLPGVGPTSPVGFGTAVSLGSPGWLMVSAPWASCESAHGPVPNAGRVYVFRVIAGEWQLHQSLCSTEPQSQAVFGGKIDASGSWMVVGAYAHRHDEPFDGRVELYRLDAATQRWRFHAAKIGRDRGLLGSAVAIDGGLAVAGEHGYDEWRGRVHTWRIVGDDAIADAPYAPAGLDAYSHYGSDLGVVSKVCAGPACTPVDLLAALGANGIHVARRAGAAWQAAQVIWPPMNARFDIGALDLGAEVLAATLTIDAHSTGTPCAAGTSVRVFRRRGSAFAFDGEACRPSEANENFGATIALARDSGVMAVSAPDGTSAPDSTVPGRVITYETAAAVTPIDTQYELSLAPGPTSGASQVYDDAFGAALSVSDTHLAVGAPWSHELWWSRGRGYVIVYGKP